MINVCYRLADGEVSHDRISGILTSFINTDVNVQRKLHVSFPHEPAPSIREKLEKYSAVVTVGGDDNEQRDLMTGQSEGLILHLGGSFLFSPSLLSKLESWLHLPGCEALLCPVSYYVYSLRRRIVSTETQRGVAAWKDEVQEPFDLHFTGGGTERFAQDYPQHHDVDPPQIQEDMIRLLYPGQSTDLTYKNGEFDRYGKVLRHLLGHEAQGFVDSQLKKYPWEPMDDETAPRVDEMNPEEVRRENIRRLEETADPEENQGSIAVVGNKLVATAV